MPPRKKLPSELKNTIDEDEDIPLYRPDDSVGEIQEVLDWYSVLIAAVAAIGALAFVMGFTYPVSSWERLQLRLVSLLTLIALCGFTPFTYELRKKFPRTMQLILPSFIEKFGIFHWLDYLPKDLKNERSGLAAELQIAELLVKTFRNQKVKVYSRLDETCLLAKAGGNDNKRKDLDILAAFPNGQKFAISVKRRAAKKIIIGKNNEVRLIRKGATERMLPDPIQEIINQEKWLRQNRKKLLSIPGSSVVLPSVRALVLASPTIVGDHEPHQYASIGSQKFVKVDRGKDFVYLLQEDQLCNFIQAVLNLK